jgi:hypothetical protein
MIVEVRTYTIKAGHRQRFVDLWVSRTKPLQMSLGMGVIGPWLDLENPDRFVWLRTFPSMDERERMKRALYESEEWTGELEGIIMPLLEEFTSVVAVVDDDDLPIPANHR